MNIRTYLTSIILILAVSVSAQNAEPHADKAHHEHHRNEIGIANSPVYFIKEKELSYDLHLHYIYNFPNTRFGLGIGYERIFDEHRHNTVGLVGSYRPIEEMCFSFSPGITFEKSSSNPKFAMHIETSYEFEMGDFHLGPAFEIAYDPEDIHISLGLHFGYGF